MRHLAYGPILLRRTQPEESVCAGAADCVELLRFSKHGLTAPRRAIRSVCHPMPVRDQRDPCGWWALHTALHFHAPEAILEKLREHTPVGVILPSHLGRWILGSTSR